MNQQQTHIDASVANEQSVLEGALNLVWGKIRTTSDLITELKQSQRSLSEKVEVLEKEVLSLRSDVVKKEQELRHLKVEYAQHLDSRGNNEFTSEENEQWKSKIKDLIAKINSHL